MSLAFYKGPDYLALPREEQPWIINPLLPVGGLVNIYGKPKSGKSYAAFGMALAIANGEHSWNGFPVLKHGPVAYFQVDTPRSFWAGRLVDAKKAGYNLDNIWFADMQTVPYPYNIIDPKHFAPLKEALARIKPVLVVIDTLRESFAGSENDSDTMRNVITNFVAASPHSAIEFVSHSRKEQSGPHAAAADLMDDARGTSYVPGRMDVIIRMTPPKRDRHGNLIAPGTFTYKGRATGQKMLEVEQDPTTNLIILAKQQHRSEWVTKARQLKAQAPELSQNEVAAVINGGSRTGQWKSIKRAISEVFEVGVVTAPPAGDMTEEPEPERDTPGTDGALSADQLSQLQAALSK